MEPASRVASPTHRILEILGWLALFTCLALLSPGVTLTAKAEGLTASAEAGPSCGVSQDQADRTASFLEQQMEMLQAQAAAQASSSQQGDFIVLNNSGFNYRPTPRSEPDPASELR